MLTVNCFASRHVRQAARWRIAANFFTWAICWLMVGLLCVPDLCGQTSVPSQTKNSEQQTSSAKFVAAEKKTVVDEWIEFRGPQGSGLATQATPPVRWSETENVAWKTEIHGRGWSSPVVRDGRIWLTTATEDGKQMFVVCVNAADGAIVHDRLLFENEEPQEIHITNSYASSTAFAEAEHVYVHFGTYGTACLDAETAQVIWQRRDFPCNHWRGAGSSPIVYENLLILHFDGIEEQYAVALNKQTGETVWRQERPDLFETDNGDNKKAYATPAVFLVDGQPQLISPHAKTTIAYEPLTGEPLWWVRYSQHSTANRPLFDGERVYIGTGFGKGSILAVDPHDARGNVTESHVRWEVKRSMPSKPSHLLVAGKLYTIQDKIGLLTCLDALTGDVLAQQRIGGTFSASPIFAGGNIYLCDEDGKTTIVSPDDALTIQAENLLPDGCMATPAAVGDSLYLRTRSSLYRLRSQP